MDLLYAVAGIAATYIVLWILIGVAFDRLKRAPRIKFNRELARMAAKHMRGP